MYILDYFVTVQCIYYRVSVQLSITVYYSYVCTEATYQGWVHVHAHFSTSTCRLGNAHAMLLESRISIFATCSSYFSKGGLRFYPMRYAMI